MRAVSGATSSHYLLKQADGGAELEAKVTATIAGGGTATQLSNPTAVVVPLPKDKTKPRISGTAKVGQLLSADHGAWSGAVRYRYQWLRCNRAGAKCIPIKHATGTSHRLTKSDAGHRIRVRTVASNGLAEPTQATSAPTRVVKSV